MEDYCVLCRYPLYEGAHVKAKRYHATGSLDRLQNIIRLCPLCHTMFDYGFVTIHPDYRIFIFSKRPDPKNPFLKFNHSYPHDNSLNRIPERYVKAHLDTQYKKEWGEREILDRFPERPPYLRLAYCYDIEKNNSEDDDGPWT